MTTTERFQAIAHELGISVFEMCNKTGISSSLLMKRGDKEANPTIRNLTLICQQYPQINPSFLILGEYPILRLTAASVIDSYPDNIDDTYHSNVAEYHSDDNQTSDESSLRQIIDAQAITIRTLQQLVESQNRHIDILSK